MQLKEDNVSDEVKETLKSIRKINVVAYPKKEGEEPKFIDYNKKKSAKKSSKKTSKKSSKKTSKKSSKKSTKKSSKKASKKSAKKITSKK